MDLNLLRAFVAVAESGGFTAAAAQLRLPKSSVSRRVSRLEGSLGLELIRRTTRRVALTETGTALYERTAPLLQSLQQAVGTLPVSEEQPVGLLRVTAPNDLGVSLLGDVAGQFVARYPAVKLDIVLTFRTVDLVAEGFDVALRVAPKLRDSSLVAKRLTAFELHVLAAPSYLARRGTPASARALAEHDWVTFRPLRFIRLGSGLRSVRFEPRGRIACDDLRFVRQAVLAGAGMGLLPSFLVNDDVASGRLVRVFPHLKASEGNLYLVHSPARHLPAKIAAFRDFMVETLRARPL